jgi:hypothetical protein
MLISHKFQIIFIKPIKVAGSSFEVALSSFCDPEDIVTPCSAIRKPDEGKVPLYQMQGQNYIDPVWKNGQKSKGAFREHMPAVEMKLGIPDEVWNDYLKVSMLRDPDDVRYSSFLWMKEKDGYPQTFEDCIKKYPDPNPNAAITHIGGKSVVDFWIRFDHLEEDIKRLEKLKTIIGLWDKFKNTNLKSHTQRLYGGITS